MDPTHHPECPHCHHSVPDTVLAFDLELWDDGETDELVCPKCKTEFRIKLVKQYTTEVVR